MKKPSRPQKTKKPQHQHTTGRYHLDRRVDQIKSAPEGQGEEDDLLTTDEIAAWWKVSKQWLELGRHYGYGPPYRQLSPNMIRYHRGDCRQFLDTRKRLSTAENEKGPSREERRKQEKAHRLSTRIEKLKTQLAEVKPT